MSSFQVSRTDRMLIGVCGGIAERLGIRAIWVRLLFILFNGLGLLAYLVMGWIGTARPKAAPSS